MSDKSENGGFTKTFKRYHESKTYNDYEECEVTFDPSCLVLDSVTDIQEIMKEMNDISLKLFTYGSFCDSQTRILQELEDEFNRWKADKLHNADLDSKEYKSEASKDRYLMVNFSDDYAAFKNAVTSEKYKLSLLQRVVRSLESYGYKLHALKDYNLAIERNS